MARIQGVPQGQAGPMVKLIYWFHARRGMKKLTGREPAYGSGIEPVRDLGASTEDDERHGQVPAGGTERLTRWKSASRTWSS